MIENSIRTLTLILVLGCFMSIFYSLSVNPLLGLLLGVVSLIIFYGMNRRLEGDIFRRSFLHFIKGILGLICVMVAFHVWWGNANLNENPIPLVVSLILMIGVVLSIYYFESLRNTIQKNDPVISIKLLCEGPSVVTSACAGSVACSVAILLMRLAGPDSPASFITIRLTDRGSIPPITLFLFFTGLILISFKAMSLRREFINFKNFSDGIYVQSNIVEFIRFRTGGDKTEIGGIFDEIWSRAKAFYSIPNWINWSIPTLGFLGTVYGISLSSELIGRILSSQQGIGQIGNDLSGAMLPLAIAFDTTLVALCLGLILMFSQTLLQRWEEMRWMETEMFLEKNPIY